jgi:site-specific recombinase
VLPGCDIVNMLCRIFGAMQSGLNIQRLFEKTSSVELLAALVSAIRPRRLKYAHQSGVKLEEITYWLEERPAYLERVRSAIVNTISASDMQYVFSESGLLTNSGFFAELQQKIISKFLPSLLPDNDLRVAVRKIFYRKDDYKWLNAIQLSSWVLFFRTLTLNVHFESPLQQQQLVSAAETLSYRIAVFGLDRRISAKAGKMLTPYNAFVEQNKEWQRFGWQAANNKLNSENNHSFSRMIQWIDMGLRQVKAFRKLTREKGTSLQQTYLTERLEQHLLRLQTIITILDPSVEVNPLQYTSYFKDVVENENTNANLRVFLSRNFYFLAYQISEHGSRTGEKYITNNLKEYRQFFGAAMIGGFVISLAAFIKVHLTNLHQPYFWASFGYGLNYALAFVIIHLLHGSIATKQPALTASTVASSLDNTNPKSPSLYNLTVMISKVTRSQLASLTGNLIIVFPLTIGIAWAYHFLTGNQIIAAQDIDKTVDAVKPHITNIWFAAVAGVLLFLSGIISGYFDNLVVYANIPKRLTHHRTLRRLLGEKGLQKTANYIDKNLGAIMGNVLLGFGLGFMIFFGKIFGIPLDIRHVTISTGFFGFALFSSGFSMPWQTIVWSGIGLAAIAFTNLLVSFSLALFTALKSRSVSVRAVVPLIKQTFKYFLIHPFDFLFPPKKERVDKKNTTAVNEIAEYAE